MATRQAYQSGDQSFKDYLIYDEITVVGENEEPDLEGSCKYGYARIDSNGEVIKVIRRTNPNAKWDWWQVGGRFNWQLETKDGQKTNSAKVKDIDFKIDQRLYKEALRIWEVAVEKDKLRPGENKDGFFMLYRPEFYINRYKNKETYAMCVSTFNTYAVITPDGKWHAIGNMGWWGCSSESDEEVYDWQVNFKKRFIDTADPEWTLTVVDCHI